MPANVRVWTFSLFFHVASWLCLPIANITSIHKAPMQLNSITPKVANSHVTDEHEFFKQTDRLSLNTLRSVRSWNFPKSYSSSSEWYLDRFPYNTEKSCPSSSFCESDAKRAIWSGRETWSERENNLKSIDLIKVTSCWQSEYFCCSLFCAWLHILSSLT